MFAINLNDPNEPTTASTQKILASVDDSEHSQIWLRYDGRAYVQQVHCGECCPEGCCSAPRIPSPRVTGTSDRKPRRTSRGCRRYIRTSKDSRRPTRILRPIGRGPRG
jgi:hypothetical protein